MLYLLYCTSEWRLVWSMREKTAADRDHLLFTQCNALSVVGREYSFVARLYDLLRSLMNCSPPCLSDRFCEQH